MAIRTKFCLTSLLGLFIVIAVLSSGCSNQQRTSGPATLNSSAGTTGWPEYSVDIIGLKFKYPSNWTFSPNINATNQLLSSKVSVTLAYIRPPCVECDAVVYVSTDKLPLGMTNEQYYNERKNYVKKYWNNQVEDLPVSTSGNNEFTGISYNYTIKGNTTPHNAREYMYVKNGTAVRIVYAAGIDVFNTYESAFNSILSTFS